MSPGGGGARRKVAITYLEITDPAAIRPARPVDAPIARVEPPDGAINRAFYEQVGADWSWTDLLGRDAAYWQAFADSVETWIIGPCAGYAELRTVGADVEIVHLGLLPAFHGRGLGGALLEFALRRGFELGSRVWLHTCTTDGPQALPNYLARGLVPYREESR